MTDKNPSIDPSVRAFHEDASTHSGYLTTDESRLSVRLATNKTKELVLGVTHFAGKSVLDIGCGDGFYSLFYFDRSSPRELVGIDAAVGAIEVANSRAGDRPVRFQTGDMHSLPFADRQFDVALLQGVLHHDDTPRVAISEAMRVSETLIILEPNGNNPILKILERVSPYHRRHGEKSYRPRQLARWVEEAGGVVEVQKLGGFVPHFAPDMVARLSKTIEPLIERTPLRTPLAAVIVMRVRHKN